MKPIASTLLMVRPAAFGYNAETAVNNSFQSADARFSSEQVLNEFDAFVQQLEQAGITVRVIEDTAEPQKPDAVFPNNWFCTLPGGRMALFPMFAPNRRLERTPDLVRQLQEWNPQAGLNDYTDYEKQDRFLEGTGSMVIDHFHRVIYACLSPRTDRELVQLFADQNGYTAVLFSALDVQGQPIYHTNVMMHIGDGYAVVCTPAITDTAERSLVTDTLVRSGHTIIAITYDQMNRFAGNLLQVQNEAGDKYTVLSRQAYDSLTALQVEALMQHSRLLPVDLTAIETTGGGSARCMMAELFT